MLRAALAVALCACAAAALAANLPMVPYAGGSAPMTPGPPQGAMIPNVPGAAGPPPTGCGDGQADFSDSCNTVFLVMGIP